MGITGDPKTFIEDTMLSLGLAAPRNPFSCWRNLFVTLPQVTNNFHQLLDA